MSDTLNGNDSGQEWLISAAKAEDDVPSFSVAGLASDVGWLDAALPAPVPVFVRFLELARRERRLTLETLAGHADIDLAELVGIAEAGQQPTPRTVYQLSRVLNVSTESLMELSGLATPRQELAQAAVRFAARSEPTVALSDEERDALNEFVKVLVDRSDS